MAQPVWVLSVDLQTKTATFQSGLADAAKSARGAFTEIKGGAGEMGREVGENMTEARHGVMLLGEEFGVHLPRALAGFIASLGPIGPAMEAAFPFLAVIALATMLIEHLAKVHEAGEKLTQDQTRFGTAVQNAFNMMDEKILQAEIRADELRNDHLGALHLQLELINKQSMAELVHAFAEVAKEADVVFEGLQSHWYTFGIGSAGAKHALDDFQTEYDSLLAKGKDSEASGLLTGTLQQAQKILAMQNLMALGVNTHAEEHNTNDAAEAAAQAELKKAGVGWTEKEVQAQVQLVDALKAQVELEAKAAQLKKLDSANAGRTAAGAMASEAAAAARESAESQTRIGSMQVQADKATADARLAAQHASIQARLDADLSFANREYEVQLAGNAKLIAALDKLAKDYPNQLKALQDKALEITQQHATQTAEITAKAAQEQAAKDLADMQQSERDKIEATRQGSAERLAAIDAAIREEAAAGLQSLSSYRELQTARVETARAAAEEERKIQEEAGKEAAEDFKVSGALMIAAQKQQDALLNSSRQTSAAQRVEQETQLANEEFTIQTIAYAKEAAALDKSGKDYEAKLKAIQDKEQQLVQSHEDELTAIKEKAEEERNQSILSSERKAISDIASGLTQSITGHETWARMVSSFADEAASGMIKNSLMILMQQDKERLSNARSAAGSAYANGEKYGGPAGFILGPVFAAAAFAGVMAFESGGIVPGVGRGDTVPAMLTPGEAVLPKGVTESLVNAARFGGSGGAVTTLHVHPTLHATINTLDADGMEDALNKHSDTLQRHFESTLRRMNR